MSLTNDESKKLEKEKMSRAINMFYGAFKNLLLYSADHPSFKKSCQNCTPIFADVFRSKFEFTLQHTDGILVIDEFFFIEESLMHYDFLKLLEDIEVEGILFLPGITGDEIAELILRLVELKKNGKNSNISVEGLHYKLHKSYDTRGVKDKNRTVFDVTYIESTYDIWLMITEKIFNKLLSDQSIAIADLVSPLDKILELTYNEPEGISEYISTIPIRNLNLQHSLHSMIISIFIGQQIGYDLASLKTLAVSALLHDIGRQLLPSDLSTGKKLTSNTLSLVERHSIDGASFLIGVQELPAVAARTSFEHHLHTDGSGYPSTNEKFPPHFFSQIIALADFASWGTLKKNYYHKPENQYRLIRTLMKKAGKNFQPILLKRLLPFFGLFPAGTQVQLSDGRIARVMKPNIKNVTRPRIQLSNQKVFDLDSDLNISILKLAPSE